jgi:nicotinamide-nucleotide amidase
MAEHTSWDDAGLAARVQALASALTVRGHWLVTAESCTGGLIAGQCTELAGSSAWFDAGLVTYSNEAKTALLGVPPALLAAHGAVSEPVARAMAAGAQAGVQARKPAQAVWAVAVTGVAGPGGGSPDKPVGTVWLAWAGPDGGIEARRCLFGGDRHAVRQQTVAEALDGLRRRLGAGLP